MQVVQRFGKSAFSKALKFVVVVAVLAIGAANPSFGEPAAADKPLLDRREAAVQAHLARQQQAIYELQRQLIPLLRRGEKDAEVQLHAAALEKEIAHRSELMARANSEVAENPFAVPGQPPVKSDRNSQALLSEETYSEAARKFLESSVDGDAQSQKAAAVMQLKLAKAMEQLAQRERQVAQLSEQLARLERNEASLPIEGTETKVFSLRNVEAPDASGTLESLFGSHLRVAIDARSNSLIVIGKSDTLSVVEAILLRLDQSDEVAEGDEATSAQAAAAPKSLLLRVFWLADGLPKGEGQEPTQFLPAAVIKAMDRLGLNEPRLVTQTVNSLEAGDQAEVEFSTQVPAMLLNQPANLNCAGRMRPMSGDRTALNMQINVQGPSIACELKGSLATPLGHYMVLGTANSVIADPASMAGGGMKGCGYGGEGAVAPVDPTTGLPRAEGEAPQLAEPKYNTSRFAFVVQLIEGESYAAEE